MNEVIEPGPMCPPHHRRVAAGARLLALGVAACAGFAFAQAPANKLPPGDPCTVVPLPLVQGAFPGAKAGVRSRRLEQYGSTECAWKDGSGQVVFAVNESYGSDTAKEEAQSTAMGFIDPLKPGAARNVRYETFAGMGSEAVAFVETADAKRGILGDGALLVMRRGEHTISLMSPALPKRGRAAALKVFEDLGRVAAKRLE